MAKKTFTCGTNSRDPVQAEGIYGARQLLGCDRDCPNPICRGPDSPEYRREIRKRMRELKEARRR